MVAVEVLILLFARREEEQKNEQEVSDDADAQPVIKNIEANKLFTANPRIFLNQNFDPSKSAEILQNTNTSAEPDLNELIQIFCRCNNSQRQEIARGYKARYMKDLADDLNEALSAPLSQLILALLEPPEFYDARTIHSAIKGLGTDVFVVTEILVTRSNAQLKKIKQAYGQLYDSTIEGDIGTDISGNGAYKRVLTLLCNADRDESMRLNPEKAKMDAQWLYHDGDLRLGTDEAAFINLLIRDNYAQLRLLFDEYQTLTGQSIEKTIESDFSGEVQKTLLTIVWAARNTPALFVEWFHEVMKGKGVRDEDLIRLVVSRSEVDLGSISDEFARRFSVPLDKAVESNCSGAFKDALVTMIKGN